MITLLIIAFIVALAALALLSPLGRSVPARPLIAFAMFAFALVLGIYSGTIHVKDTETGIIIKEIGSNMPTGGIVALNGEKGPQVDILGPGYHFWYAPWNYSLEPVPTYTVAQGHVGIVLALDGKPLPEGQVYAPEWSNAKDMLDGRKFLQNGFRGPQSTVLPPGQYRYNPRLFKVESRPSLVVHVGEVAVVKSNFGKVYEGGDLQMVNGTPLVPRGYRGIWKEVLQPGAYNIHPDAFTIVKVQSTQRVYTYQKSDKNDDSILVRSRDGFSFPIEARIAISLSGVDAPYLVALLGDPDKVMKNMQEAGEELEVLEARIVYPAVVALLRNAGERLGALEFLSQRSQIEKEMAVSLKNTFEKDKLQLDGVFIANIGLDSTEQGRALLTTQTNQEVAKNEQRMFEQQKIAQASRSDFVKAQEEADQQKQLAAAKYAALVAGENAKRDVEKAKGEALAAIERAKGEAEATRITFEARTAGYKAMSSAIGEDGVTKLELLKLVKEGNIQITPQVMMQGGAANVTDALAGTMLATQLKSPKTEPTAK